MTQLDIRALAQQVHEQAVADFRVSERFAYSFVMKVKQIRDERLYKELGYDSFDAYCDNAWGITRDFMDQRIQIADAFGEGNFADTYRQLGHSKSLLLARMEPEIRQQIESRSNVNEMTVKQLKEAQQRAQEAEQRATKAESEARHWQGVAQSNQPTRIVTKTVEVVPEKISRELQSSKYKIEGLERQLEQTKKQLEDVENLRKAYEKDSKEYNELKSQIEFLHHEKNDLHRQIESATALSGLAVEIDNFIKTKLAPVRYSRALERLDSEVAVKNLTEIIETVEHWCEDMRRYLPKNNRKVVIDYDPTG